MFDIAIFSQNLSTFKNNFLKKIAIKVDINGGAIREDSVISVLFVKILCLKRRKKMARKTLTTGHILFFSSGLLKYATCR